MGCLAAGVTALLLLIAARETRAQTLWLGNWRGALEGLVDFQHQDTKTSGSPQTTLDNTRTEERFSLATEGAYLYDPRLLSLSLGGSFGLSQNEFTSDPGSSSSQNGRLWGYNLFANILAESPFSLNLFANRNQDFLSGPFSGQTDVTIENRGARLLLPRLYIPSTVTFRQENIDQESRTGDVVSDRRNRGNIVRYEGLRGWTDSEMSAYYEYLDNTDEVFPDLSYISHDGSLNYGMDFGTELNWHWYSSGRYITRTGDRTDLTTLTVDELLRVNHSPTLESDYRGLLIQTSNFGVEATTYSGDAALHHWLYENLATTTGLDTVIQDLPGGHRDRYEGRLDFAYKKQLPQDGRLIVGLGGRFGYEDERFPLGEASVPQESHTASTPLALPIPLDNPFVVTSSVVVTKVAVGPLPPGCIPPPGPPTPLELNRDYTLDTVGNITFIRPVPCAGTIPGINPGDTIAVDYSFATPTQLGFTTAIWHAGLSVDYGWIRPYYTHQQTDQSLVSGTDGQFLNNQRSDILGIEFTRTSGRARGSLLSEVQRFVSNQITYNSIRGAQFAEFPLSSELVLSLNGDESHFDFANPDRKSDQLRGVATLTYAFGAVLFADASSEILSLKYTSQPSELKIDAALRLRWFVEQLEVSPSLEVFDLRIGHTDTQQVRVVLRTIRRF